VTGTERRSKQIHSLTSMPSIPMLRCFRRSRIHTNTTKTAQLPSWESTRFIYQSRSANTPLASFRPMITQSPPSEENRSSANTGLPRRCIFFAVRCSKEYGTDDFVNANFGQFGHYDTNKDSGTCGKKPHKRVSIERSRRAAATVLHMSS
jgi:hypothetical protein